MERKIDFRFWCPPGNHFVDNYKYSGLVSELFDHDDILIPSQYTEVDDADGNQIYEGDIALIELKGWNRKYIGVVEYDDGGFCFRLNNPEGTLSRLGFREIRIFDGIVRVLGNKFENPELFETYES